jgi:hypothetical protein
MVTPRNIRQKVKNTTTLRKEIIDGDVTVNHLVRSLPFSTKTRLCTIRRGALFQTLSGMKTRVRKSYSLTKLLEIAKEQLGYYKVLTRVNSALSKLQKKFREYYQNLELRLQGPGIPCSRCVNDECPYTMETLTDIPKSNLFTWKDDKIYGCDFKPLYELFSSKLEGGNTLYECKESEYSSVIEEYAKLSRRKVHRRSFSRCKLWHVSNPFTRQPFPSEAFYRLLQIGKRHGLMSKEVQNRRIRQRQNRSMTNLNQAIHEQEDSNTGRQNVIEISTSVSEYLRNLDFYTPETILTDIIRPIYDYTHNVGSPVPIDVTHSLRIRDYITQSCIPVLEHLVDHYSSQVIRSVITNRHPMFGFYRSFRRGHYVRMLNEQNGHIHDIIQNYNDITTVRSRIRRFSRTFLSIWYQTLQILQEVFGSENVNVEDKKSIAIFIIISLAQTGHLREGFEWAIGI